LARPERTVEDRLREEYFDLLPDIRRVAEELEAEVKHCLLPISLRLDKYERLLVTSRVKECESALGSLRRRQEGATFDSGRPELYSLERLNDLAGVRVLAFPHSRLVEADRKLRGRFPSWTADPISGYNENDEPLALKYFGYCRASGRIRAEFQIVPMLTALFWEIEHSVIYKPSPRLKGVARSLEMQKRTRAVLKGLKAFEDEFADLIRRDPLAEKRKKRKKQRQETGHEGS
jgi:ppGpp synthetase/RelA/SpoT-type nucleotidyltranferase